MKVYFTGDDSPTCPQQARSNSRNWCIPQEAKVPRLFALALAEIAANPATVADSGSPFTEVAITLTGGDLGLTCYVAETVPADCARRHMLNTLGLHCAYSKGSRRLAR